MEPGKLGLNPFTHTLTTMRKALAIASFFDSLGKAPATSPGYSLLVKKLTGGDIGVDGNDQWGNCVFADVAHRIMLRTAQAGVMVVPTRDETIKLYSEVTGFDGNPWTDRGGDLVTTAHFMQRKGMLLGGIRHTEDGNGIIDPANWDHSKWAITLFGCVPMGFRLPQSALDQFEAGLPFDYVEGSPYAGGHDMLAVEYQPETSDSDPGWKLATWGKFWPATDRFMKAFVTEVVPVGSKDFITPSGVTPSGIDLKRTLQLLKEIN